MVLDKIECGKFTVDISAYVTRVGYDKDEVFAYQETEIKSYCADLWTKVKAH